jgi:hypothetical protein
MRKGIEVIRERKDAFNPKNGATRIEVDRDGQRHLECFYNGSWRHDQRCKEKTNPECNIKS